MAVQGDDVGSGFDHCDRSEAGNAPGLGLGHQCAVVAEQGAGLAGGILCQPLAMPFLTTTGTRKK